jgi:hypothetical protein
VLEYLTSARPWDPSPAPPKQETKQKISNSNDFLTQCSDIHVGEKYSKYKKKIYNNLDFYIVILVFRVVYKSALL